MSKWLLATLFALTLAGCSAYGETGPTLCVDPAFSPDRLEQIDDAIDEWNVKGDARITERIGNLDAGDCVPVRPTNSLPEGVKGRTHLVPGHEYILLPDSGQYFRESALHEIGHLLTGASHSTDEHDVMFAYPPASDTDGSRHLTASDLARLR